MQPFFYSSLFYCILSLVSLALYGEALVSSRKPHAAVSSSAAALMINPITQEEKKVLDRIDDENTHEITDELLEARLKNDTTEAEYEVTVSPSLKDKLKEFGRSIAEKSDVLGSINRSSPLTFNIGFGTFSFAPTVDPTKKGILLRIGFTAKDATQQKTLPFYIPGATLALNEDRLKSKINTGDKITFLGTEAVFRLKSIIVGEGELISRIVFEVFFVTPIKKKLPFGEELVIKKGFLTLKSSGEYPCILTARTTFAGHDVRLMLLCRPDKISAAIKVFNIKLGELIPPLNNTALKGLKVIRGRVVVDLWVPGSGTDPISRLTDTTSREVRIEGDIESVRELALIDGMDDIDSQREQKELAEQLTHDIGTIPYEATTNPSFATDLGDVVDDSMPDITKIALEQLDRTDAGSRQEDRTGQIYKALTEEEARHATLVSDTKGFDVVLDTPDLVGTDTASISPELLEEGLPEIEPVEPAFSFEEARDTFQDTCQYNDPCCISKGEEPPLTCSFQAAVGLFSQYVSIAFNSLVVPHVGYLQNVHLTFSTQRSKDMREDFDALSDAEKKTLSQSQGEISLGVRCFPVKHIGVIEDAVITFQRTAQEKEKVAGVITNRTRNSVHVKGKTVLHINPLGKLPFLVDATISKQGITFQGTLDFCQSYETQTKQTETGWRSSQEKCTKNTLTYKGLRLEKVRVIYGKEPLSAAERQKRAEAREARQLVPQNAMQLLPARSKTLTIVGFVKLFGIRFMVSLSRVINPKNSSEQGVGFSAGALIKEFRPFKQIPSLSRFPELQKVVFTDLSAQINMGVRGNRPWPTVTLAGNAFLFGAVIRSTIKFITDKAGKPGLLVFTSPQQQQSLTDLCPLLQGAFFKGITCCNGSFIISTVDGVDTALLTPEEYLQLAPYDIERIKRGVGFVANVPFTGSLAQVGSWLGLNRKKNSEELQQQKELAEMEKVLRAQGKQVPVRDTCSSDQPMFRMTGMISPKIINSSFRIGVTSHALRQGDSVRSTPELKSGMLDTQLSNSHFNTLSTGYTPDIPELAAPASSPRPSGHRPMIEMDQVEVYFLGNGANPSLGAAAGIIVRPTAHEELRLKGVVEFSPTTISLGAQMLGRWKNAFTLKGFDMSDVSLVLGFLYGSPIPTRLGGSATVHIKDFDAGFKFMADANLTDMGFEGHISQVLTIADLVVIFLKAVGVSLPDVSKIPMPLQIYNAYIRYAPMEMRIGDAILEAGFAIKADIKILGKNGKIDMHLDASGLKAFGTLEKVNFHDLLVITSADGKGDPTLDVELGFERQKFLITGLIKVADLVTASAYLELSSQGLFFKFLSAVGDTLFEGRPLLAATVAGSGTGSFQDPAFVISFDFEQHFQQYIKKEGAAALQTAIKEVNKALGEAQSEIRKIKTVKADAERQIIAARKKVDDARQALKAIQEARRKSDKALEDAQKKVSIIQQEIRSLDKWYNALPNA